MVLVKTIISLFIETISLRLNGYLLEELIYRIHQLFREDKTYIFGQLKNHVILNKFFGAKIL